jgi:hypothetical protein
VLGQVSDGGLVQLTMSCNGVGVGLLHQYLLSKLFFGLQNQE